MCFFCKSLRNSVCACVVNRCVSREKKNKAKNFSKSTLVSKKKINKQKKRKEEDTQREIDRRNTEQTNGKKMKEAILHKKYCSLTHQNKLYKKKKKKKETKNIH